MRTLGATSCESTGSFWDDSDGRDGHQAVLLIGADRSRLLACFAQRGMAAYIGEAGAFAAEVLVQLKPKRLCLIAPMHEAAQGREPVNGLPAGFEGAMRAGVITLHRSGETGIDSFPDEYFDLVYLEGAADGAACLAALRSLAPKVKPSGWISGSGYQALEGPGRRGVVKAVNQFVIESGCHFFALTNEASPTYVIAKDADTPEAAELMSTLAGSGLVDAQIVHAERKVFEQIEVPGSPQKTILSFN
jgi:hypothetical protein